MGTSTSRLPRLHRESILRVIAVTALAALHASVVAGASTPSSSLAPVIPLAETAARSAPIVRPGSPATSQGTLVFLPPAVPIFTPAGFARPETPRPTPSGLHDFAAPDTLALFVGEIFYPVLGTRLADHSLTKKQESRLHAYQERRDALVNEIKDALLALRPKDPTTRIAVLEELGGRHAPRIEALEKEAVALRDELMTSRFFEKEINWFTRRIWSFDNTDINPDDLPVVEAQVIRMAAYYQKGVSVEQRGLFEETAEELKARGRINDFPGDLTALADEVFEFGFDPAPGRVRTAPSLSAALKDALDRYTRDNSILKKEIRATVIAHADESEKKRTAAFAAFATQQHAAITALALQAEEIRRMMFPPSAPPGAPKRENSAAAFTGRIALFQIGLSPAQRRLLFSAGLREIDLPLPAGERLARFPDRLFPTGEIPE